MIIFITVPIPGFCFRKIHKNKTLTLTINVAAPIDMPVFLDIPSANTDQGELPVVDKTKRPSPKPNKTNPRQRKKKVENLGLKFKGFSELQVFIGIFLIVKNIINQRSYSITEFMYKQQKISLSIFSYNIFSL